jgi:hypothetical protein
VRFRSLNPITVGVAGVTGTGGLGLTALQVARDHDLPAGAWILMIASLIATSTVPAIAVILGYQLRKMAVRASSKSAERAAALRESRLELQRAILSRLPENQDGAEAYRIMTSADAMYLLVEQGGLSRTGESCVGRAPWPSSRPRSRLPQA